MATTPIPTDAGPLVVSEVNPRYFTHRSGPNAGRAVYLTGSHIWNNLQDGLGPGAESPDELERFDFEGYLAFLTERGHNFIRLWRWEHFRSQASGGNFHLNMTPQPWARTGRGSAKDGQPRFDLDRFDESYFTRLRERVDAARQAGIYVGVLLFDGWGLHLSPPPDHIEGHPFHAQNNINEIAATSINDLQVLPLDPRVAAVQDAYLRKVIDTVHDLPNVLFEVANESTGDGTVTEEFAGFLGMDEPPSWGDSTQWQYRVIDVVKRHVAERGYQSHPIGMSMQFPVADQTRVNEPLFRSDAEWVSPGYDDEIFADGGHPVEPGSPPSHWFADPPPADGSKIILSDIDHYAPGSGDALWAWKTFLRGHHPVLMDFGLIGGVHPPDGSSGEEGEASFETFEPARWAMGDTRRFAERADLVRMEPRTDLSSTRFALAYPGHEYLVLEPSGSGEEFSVALPAGRYDLEWFGITSRSRNAEQLQVDQDAQTGFVSPLAEEPSVLYLQALSHT